MKRIQSMTFTALAIVAILSIGACGLTSYSVIQPSPGSRVESMVAATTSLVAGEPRDTTEHYVQLCLADARNQTGYRDNAVVNSDPAKFAAFQDVYVKCVEHQGNGYFVGGYTVDPKLREVLHSPVHINPH